MWNKLYCNSIKALYVTNSNIAETESRITEFRIRELMRIHVKSSLWATEFICKQLRCLCFYMQTFLIWWEQKRIHVKIFKIHSVLLVCLQIKSRLHSWIIKLSLFSLLLFMPLIPVRFRLAACEYGSLISIALE